MNLNSAIMKTLSMKWVAITAMLLIFSSVAAQNTSSSTTRKRPVAILYDGKTFLGIPIFATLEEVCTQLKKMGSLMDSPDIEDTFYWVDNAKYRGNEISNVEVEVTTEDGATRSMSAAWTNIKSQAEADKKLQELVTMVSKYVTLEKDSEGIYRGSFTNTEGQTHIVKIIGWEQGASLYIINPGHASMYEGF